MALAILIANAIAMHCNVFVRMDENLLERQSCLPKQVLMLRAVSRKSFISLRKSCASSSDTSGLEMCKIAPSAGLLGNRFRPASQSSPWAVARCVSIVSKRVFSARHCTQ